MSSEGVLEQVEDKIEREWRSYAHGHDRPLGSYTGITATYLTVGSALLAAAATTGRLPDRIEARDLALITVATHKLSRTIAKDPITSPLRAFFTRFEGSSGPSELREEVRGGGWKRALGELVTCPFCVAQYVATALVFGHLFAPRATRAFVTILTAKTGSDLLQFAYAAAERTAEG